jgi:two-component system sensor histidine kinase KdpD
MAGVRFSRHVPHRFIRAGIPLLLVASVSAVISVARQMTPAPGLFVLYTPAVIASAVYVGPRASVVAAIASFVAFDIFFIEPLYTITAHDPADWVSLGALLFTGLVTAQLSAIAKRREEAAVESERAAGLLYRIARVMRSPSLEAGVQATADLIRIAVGAEAVTIDAPVGEKTVQVGAGATSVIARVRRVGRFGHGRILTEEDDSGPGFRPRRWIRTRSGLRGADREPYDLYHVRLEAGGSEGWLSVALARGAPALAPGTQRMLLAAAAEIDEAIERERFRLEANEVEVLRREDEIKNALLNTVSHDLRTPLAAIMAAAESLRSDVPWSDEDREDFLLSISEEATRLDRLVRHLLDLSRIEAGTLQLQREWHDPDDAVRATVARLREQWPGRAIAVASTGNLPPARIDPIAIGEAIVNLIENACRHTPPTTTITVHVTADGGTLRLTVEDDGPGIPPEELGRMFRPFERARGLRDRRGTGLGLAVTQALVEAHGGTITASNRPEGGARFTIELPDALSAPGAVAVR